jgi:hypothetical protein
VLIELPLGSHCRGRYVAGICDRMLLIMSIGKMVNGSERRELAWWVDAIAAILLGKRRVRHRRRLEM